jgi:spore coat protein U-like protein
VQPLSFGDYDMFYPAPLDSQAFINLQCSTNDPFRVTVDSGLNGDGSFSLRRMSSTGRTNLLYNLYLDPSRRQIWGDGNGNSSFYSATPLNGRAQIPIYGRVPPAQPVETGIYRDSVIVTVEW